MAVYHESKDRFRANQTSFENLRMSVCLLLLCGPLLLASGAEIGADIVKHEALDSLHSKPNAMPPMPVDTSQSQDDDQSPAEEGKKGLGPIGKDGEAEQRFDFWHGFVASLSVIIVSELGDKTWFIAAILAMRHSRLTVFSGAIAALAVMTALSAGLGWVTQIIPRTVTYYVSTALFAIFGLKMLKEGYDMSPNVAQEEYEEAQADIKKKEEELERDSGKSQDVEAGGSPSAPSGLRRFISPIFLESLTLTLVAEWGDRSQLATILLAARENVVAVTVGGVLGHAICTGIAVLGGRMVAQRISVRTVTLIGGVVFIVFALSALFLDPDSV